VVGDYLLNATRKNKEELPVPDLIALVHSEETRKFAQILKEEFRQKREGIQVLRKYLQVSCVTKVPLLWL